MYIEPNPTFEELEEEIRITEMVYEALDEAEKITHKWFSEDDEKQQMVQYAYKLWWIDFVKMIECENWNRNPNAIGDSGKAFWLCQINTNYHRLPEWYKENWKVQVEECYRKRSTWTRFYWPSRKVKGTSCANYVSDRFILE